MNRVSITNPDLSKQETTKLTAAAVAGTDVVLAVENNQGFVANDLVVIQSAGREKCEKEKIKEIATGNSSITVSTLKFSHLEDEEIRKTPYDQVVLYFSATKEGTYAAVGTWVDINFDDLATYINHDAGTSDTWYKAGFKNSVSGLESALSVAFQITADVHYCTINEVLEEAGMIGNRYIAPERVLRLRAEAESEVKGSIGSRYALPLASVPEIVRDATKLIAAGKLLWQEYGTDADGTVNDGLAKIKAGRSILKSIREGDIILLNTSDAELTQTGDQGVSGWPDETTAEASDEDAGGAVNFRISQKF